MGGCQLDDLISHAEETKGAFAAQRSMFGDIQGRLKTMGAKMPVVRQLLGAFFQWGMEGLGGEACRVWVVGFGWLRKDRKGSRNLRLGLGSAVV